MHIDVFDSTLRDGAQGEGISFSVSDKIKIVECLRELDIPFIEAGNPGSNPKDLEFFEKLKSMDLKNSKIVAFGSTRKANTKASEDRQIQSILSVQTEYVSIFGKTWDLHVVDVLQTSLEENLQMIFDTVSYLVSQGKKVFFDCEHFFDGYKNHPEYAIKCLEQAVKAGAYSLALCDTNGGTMPLEIYDITKKVVEKFSINIGIHCHNDCGFAVANSVLAVMAGAKHVQGTFTGYGERCGNTSLSTLIPNLQLKCQYELIPQEKIKSLTHVARAISEISNMPLADREPFVGKSAFSHKAGMHIDGVEKNQKSFEHIDPETVGNERRFLTSEIAGRSTILKKIKKINPHIEKNSKETEQIIERLKELEYQGYQFEAAESTVDLVIRKQLGKYKPFFELLSFKTIIEQNKTDALATAVIKVCVDNKEEITAAEGKGPVNALDKALRKALEVFYPELKCVHLTDYKVRVLESNSATASKVRVLIESSDGTNFWTTVGVSHDIIEASKIALIDSIEFKLIKEVEKKYRALW